MWSPPWVHHGYGVHRGYGVHYGYGVHHGTYVVKQQNTCNIGPIGPMGVSEKYTTRIRRRKEKCLSMIYGFAVGINERMWLYRPVRRRYTLYIYVIIGTIRVHCGYGDHHGFDVHNEYGVHYVYVCGLYVCSWRTLIFGCPKEPSP